MHKKYIIFTIRTSYMFRPPWVIFRENSFVTLRLHLYSWVNSLRSDRREFTLPLNGVRSQWHDFTQLYKCNPNVTKMFSLKMTQRCRNM
jgi:hypothetical protein